MIIGLPIHRLKPRRKHLQITATDIIVIHCRALPLALSASDVQAYSIILRFLSADQRPLNPIREHLCTHLHLRPFRHLRARTDFREALGLHLQCQFARSLLHLREHKKRLPLHLRKSHRRTVHGQFRRQSPHFRRRFLRRTYREGFQHFNIRSRIVETHYRLYKKHRSLVGRHDIELILTGNQRDECGDIWNYPFHN